MGVKRGPVLPFWDKVKKGAPNECWPWLGYVKTKQNGHGLTSYKSVPMHASRKAWILTHGPIRNGLNVNHKCDFKLCCNPTHMYLGTQGDNVIDYFTKCPPEQRRTGRKTILSDEQLGELWVMRRNGALLTTCAARFNVHIATICRYITNIRKAKLERNRADKASALRTY